MREQRGKVVEEVTMSVKIVLEEKAPERNAMASVAAARTCL